MLRVLGVWHFKHWSGPLSETGISDIIGCLDGRMFVIELKRPGGKASQDQLDFIAKVKSAGGIGFVADNVDDVVLGLDLQDRFLPGTIKEEKS